MTPLPVVSGRECVRRFEKIGFTVIRQRGSHILVRREIPYARLVIPNHQELDRGTLRAVIRQAEISVDDFVRLLRT